MKKVSGTDLSQFSVTLTFLKVSSTDTRPREDVTVLIVYTDELKISSIYEPFVYGDRIWLIYFSYTLFRIWTRRI